MLKKTTRVLVVDDHTLFRKGLVVMLESFEDIEVVHDCANGAEALDFLRLNPIHVVLLDLDMPVLDGREAAKKIISKYPGTHIIIISMNDTLEVIAELIEIGVHSYLLKDAEPQEVKRAILSVINNDFYYNHLVSRALRQNFQRSNNKPNTDPVGKSILSPREIEVLQLICREMTVKEISEELHLSEQTILTHRKHLMKKIQAKNAVSLVRFAIQNQIITF
ncbi:MAG: response regulator transcription factor [Bacteroidota bacterium]